MRFYKPGERRGNKTYIIRGHIAGRSHEYRCQGARTRRAAEREWEEYKRAVLAELDRVTPSAGRTFREVAEMYVEARQPSRNERRYIEKMTGGAKEGKYVPGHHIADKEITDITPAMVQQMAHDLYPGCKNETKNRQAIVPASAILHFAAREEMRPWIVVDRLKESEPPTKRPEKGLQDRYIAAAPNLRQRLLLTLIRDQGWRIGECLSLTADCVDVDGMRLSVWVSKARKWKRVYMSDGVRDAFLDLLNAGEPLAGHRDGERVFPWSERGRVYKWLDQIAGAHSLPKFRPHQGRHEFGSALDELGVSSHGMTEVGTWTSTKSTERYKSAREEHARSVLRRLRNGADTG